ncbi:uncharacterized protein TEOVI_000558300 [Trypanosoma equiperdum]|uniref:Uncharacterized protein n=2 Tax=Trypanozoon TaxID=39700 RepID=Q584F7_TRYB2|nr:hypothetical protein, conserved [Trypanosoma brucei brucei TREU927]AAX79048.1 hypothetical protein, conserved [Trypanosoma brucei]AAZ10821.1 hypothetical protein, conserved [Trypanosoma brucei brucei TREU927]SCU66189.1 hypothetical protein, conserved [Trypanosoma equiperdum]
MSAVSSPKQSQHSDVKFPEIVPRMDEAMDEVKEEAQVEREEVEEEFHLPVCFRMHYDALPYPRTNVFRGPSTYRLHSQIVLPFIKPLSSATVGELVSRFTARAFKCYPELSDFVVEALYPCFQGTTTSGDNVFIGHLSDRIVVKEHAASPLLSFLAPTTPGKTAVYDLFTLWRGTKTRCGSAQMPVLAPICHNADMKNGGRQQENAMIYTWPNVSLSEIPYPLKHRCPLTKLPPLFSSGEEGGLCDGLPAVHSRLNPEQRKLLDQLVGFESEERHARSSILEDEGVSWRSFREWELDARRRTVVLLRLKSRDASKVPLCGLEEFNVPEFPRTYPVDTVPLISPEKMVKLEKVKEYSIDTVWLSRAFARYEKRQSCDTNDTQPQPLPSKLRECNGNAVASSAQLGENIDNSVDKGDESDEMDELIDQFADFRRDLLMLERKEFRSLTAGFRLILERQREFEEEYMKEIMADELRGTDVLDAESYEAPYDSQNVNGAWTCVARMSASPQDYSANLPNGCAASSPAPPSTCASPAKVVKEVELVGDSPKFPSYEKRECDIGVKAVTCPDFEDGIPYRKILTDKEARVRAALDTIERIDSQWSEPMWLKVGKRRVEHCEADVRRKLYADEVARRCDICICQRQDVEHMKEKKRLALVRAFEPIVEGEEEDRMAIYEEEERWRSLLLSLCLRGVVLLKTFRPQRWGWDDDV